MYYALGEASVLVGNVVGAGRLELVPLVAPRALCLGVACTALCTVVFAVAARPIALLAHRREIVLGAILLWRRVASGAWREAAASSQRQAPTDRCRRAVS